MLGATLLEVSVAMDVVVLGCGVAGLSAAVSAAEHGARVIVLERAPARDRGGNSRYTSAWMRMSSPDDVSDDLVDLLVERGHGAIPPDYVDTTTRDVAAWPPNVRSYPFNDPEVIDALVTNAPPTMHWLAGHGIGFTYYEPALLETGSVRMGPSGGGLAIVETLVGVAERLGVEVQYETTGRGLLFDDTGAIRGVRCWSRHRGGFDIEAPNVVVASGGFQGNVEMMTRYVGRHAHFARPVSAGGRYNKGEGIDMMLAAGAAPAGQYDMFHACPMDPRSTHPEPMVGVVNFGILVDDRGHRFLDEGTDRYELFYDEVAWTVMRRRNGLAWFLFDQRLLDVPNVRSRIHTDVDPVRGSSIADLAARIGVPTGALERTVRAYNAAAGPPGPYDVSRLDGVGTEGLVPPKSNWARPLDESDLYAYPIMCGSTFTCGGVKITKHAEVVNNDGDVIPGLFAAGETTGLYYNLYVGATSVLRGLVFGREAGRRIGELRAKR